MQRTDFLKIIRKIERHWDVELDRIRWWRNIKNSPGPLVDWKLKRCWKYDKAPTIPMIATWSFVLEDFPGYIQLWWQEKYYTTWPKLNNRFVCPEHLAPIDRHILRLYGSENGWAPWKSS